MRHGKQRYPHLVVDVKDDKTTIELNASEEEVAAINKKRAATSKKHTPLTKTMSGPHHQVVAKLFKGLTGKRMFMPGAFNSRNGNKAVTCALKSSEGLLYPLDKSFFFIHKPATLVRYEDVSSVEFLRISTNAGGVTARTCDLEVRRISRMHFYDRMFAVRRIAANSDGAFCFCCHQVKCRSMAGDAPRTYTFTSIDRKEYEGLFAYLREKGLKITNVVAEQQVRAA